MKDVGFYNKESENYSAKRYPKTAITYVQFFFKRRREIVLSELRKLARGKRGLSLMEVGCADGVILQSVSKSFPGVFSSLVGVDTSPEMVKQARAQSGEVAQFFVRGEGTSGKRFDVILEIGVANYADIDEELAHAKHLLKDDGVYGLSLAGSGSLNGYFGKGVGYKNFLSYREYEEKIRRVFLIKKIIPCGFFIPLLWRVPPAARVIQKISEYIFVSFAPNLFHEKIYILKLKV
ncbi:MAG: class I SAM-dependent methyltransferase [Minisyncoccota bacterium]